MSIPYLTRVGLARETTWGSSTPPVVLLPVDPPTFTNNFEQILDQSIRGFPVMDFAAYQGVGRIEASLEGNFYPEELGFLLFAMMGSCVTSGTAAPFNHVFSVGANPPALSIQEENSIRTHRYTGCMPSELTLTYNSAEGLLRWSATLVGRQRINSPVGAVPVDASAAPFRAWQVTAAIGTAVPFGKVIEGEITLSREINPYFFDNSLQVPGTAFAGPLEVTGRATIIYNAATDIDRYFLKTQELFRLTWSYGTGTTERTLIFDANRMDFGESPVEIDYGGAALTLAYAMRGLYNITDAGNCRLTLRNARASY